LNALLNAVLTELLIAIQRKTEWAPRENLVYQMCKAALGGALDPVPKLEPQEAKPCLGKKQKKEKTNQEELNY